MLNIRIRLIGNYPNYELELDGNGKGYGHHRAFSPTEEVQWEVTGSTIQSISGIEWKNTSGSTNIFPPAGTSGSPMPVGNGRVWKARINNIDQPVIYVYSIKYRVGGVEYTQDPIISINPTTSFFKNLIGPLIGAIVGGLATLIFWMMDRRKLNAENDRLKERLRLKDGKDENE